VMYLVVNPQSEMRRRIEGVCSLVDANKAVMKPVAPTSIEELETILETGQVADRRDAEALIKKLKIKRDGYLLAGVE
jgi:hypothetical protein